MLLASKQQLQSYTQHLQEKNLLIEEFTTQLEKYTTDAMTDQNKIIQTLQQFTILTDDDWIKFQQMFEQVYAGYLFRLKENFQGLTPGEIRFILLSKLRLSTKEMANILGVGTSAIRKYKHQVRNKLMLPEDAEILTAIDNV